MGSPPGLQPFLVGRAGLRTGVIRPLPGHVRDGWASAALRKVTATPIPNELVAVLLPL
jgi:hypothetical protein